MKTSTSFCTVASRRSKMVDAGRGATVSAMVLFRSAGLRLQIGAAVDARDARQEIVDFGLGGRGDGGARLALRAAGNDAALLQNVFAYRKSRTRLLLVTDQRQMRVEQIVRGVALAGLRQFYDINQQF